MVELSVLKMTRFCFLPTYKLPHKLIEIVYAHVFPNASRWECSVVYVGARVSTGPRAAPARGVSTGALRNRVFWKNPVSGQGQRWSLWGLVFFPGVLLVGAGVGNKADPIIL